MGTEPEPSSANPVRRILEARGIPYRFFRHPGPVDSVEQAARERGLSPAQVIRSLLFRLGQAEFILVLMTGGKQVSWPRLRSYLGQSRLTLASQAEVLQVTGFPVGAVSPLGLAHPLRILIDCSVLEPEVISIGCGERGATIILTAADLQRLLEPVEVVDLGADDSPE